MLQVFTALFVYGYIVTPALAVYSWVRWSRSQRRHSRRVRLSLTGLSVASGSLVLGVAAVSFSSMRRHAFLYLAPGLHALYIVGLVTSALAVLIALAGAFQDNPIRLKALLVALGAVDLWFLAGSGQ